MAHVARRLRDLGHGWWEWIQESQIRQVRHWILVGIGAGLVVGQIAKKIDKYRGIYGDHIIVTEFNVSLEDSQHFEALWNSQARLAQKFEGYLGTRLYKAMNRDWPERRALKKEELQRKHNEEKIVGQGMSSTSETVKLDPQLYTDTVQDALPEDKLLPCQYIQLRMWRSPYHEGAWLDDVGAQNVRKQISDICRSVVSREYATVCNDAVCRQIL